MRLGLLLGSLACLFASTRVGAVFGGEDIISMAVGFQGINELGQQPRLQESLDLSPEQVSKLQEFLADERLKTEYRKAVSDARALGATFELAESHAMRALDKIVQKEVTRILEDDQLTALRHLHLRRRFPRPSLVFERNALADLGFDKTEISAVLAQVEPMILEMAKDRQERIKKALSEILDEFTDEQRSKVANLIGGELVGNRSAPTVVDVVELEIMRESKPTFQVSRALIATLPKDEAFTRDQRRLLRNLLDKDLGREAKDPTSNREAEVRSELASILSKTQQVSLIQAMHRQMLMGDLNWLSRKEVVSYIGLPEASIISLHERLAKLQAKLTEVQTAAEKRIFQMGLLALPKGRSSDVEKLFEGVW